MNKLRNLAIAVITSFGLSFLVQLEGYKLKAYLDGANVPTICVGHTKGVRIGDVATKAQCEVYLKEDIKVSEAVVRKYVKVTITQNQYDALVLFVFNVGETNFRTSTLLRKLNASDIIGASDEFVKWNRITVNGSKVESKGLTNRRIAERNLFLKDYL
jgi:lysozyme